MKLKYFVGIVFGATVGGFMVYKLLNKKECCDTTSVSGNESKKSSEVKCEENMEQNDEVIKNEKKSDAIMHKVYENMSVRNEHAQQILSDIHDDMKKSEENITSKKEDIERMMEKLKK